MALLVAEGFEHVLGSADVARRFTDASSGVPSSMSITAGRLPGGRCLRATDGQAFSMRTAGLSPGSTTAILGFAARTHGTASSAVIVGLMNSSNAYQLKIEVTNIGGVQQIALKRGATTLYASPNFDLDEFLFIELFATIHASLGVWEFRINGMTVGYGTGNTSDSGTSGFSKLVVAPSADAGVTNYADVDDLYLLDDTGNVLNRMLGPVCLEALYGTRLVTENVQPWVPNTGTNKAAVDDGNVGPADDDTTYVTNDPTVDVLDLYGMSNAVSCRSTALNVRLIQDVKNTSGAADFFPTMDRIERTVFDVIAVGAASPYATYKTDVDPMSSEDIADTSFGFADTMPAAVKPIPLP